MNYDDELSPLGYDEAPHYEWGPDFDFSLFAIALETATHDERFHFEHNLRDGGLELPQAERFDWRLYRNHSNYQRVIGGLGTPGAHD